MGLCCGKGAMPVVTDTRHQNHFTKPRAVLSGIPAVEFHFIRSMDSPDLAMTLTGSRFGFNLDQSVHTVSDWGISISGAHCRTLSDTLREDARSLVSKGLGDVQTGQVDRFVNAILQLGTLEPHNMMEDSMPSLLSNNRSFTCGTVPGTVGRLNSLTGDNQRHLEQSQSVMERIKRLVEMEQIARQEISGTWKMNTVFFSLVLRRVVPTIRRRHVPRAHNKEDTREVLVIHSKDIELQMNNADGGNDGGSSCNNGTGRLIESPIFSREKNKNVHFAPRDEGRSDNRKEEPPLVTERYQILALTAREISITADVRAQVVKDTWDFLSLPDATNHLNAGNVFFRFLTCPIPSLDKESIDLIDTFINLSGFPNEMEENNVPRIDIHSPEEQAKYVGILVKAMYLLPGVRLSEITSELLASLDYQRNCQPGDNKFENCDVPYTFRTVKTVIKYVYSVTIQMKVTEITDPEVLRNFSHVDGMVPARVLLLERTKKNIYKVDSTVKVRSVLLYYPVSDGVLVNNQTIVLNSSLPRVVSSLMQTFSSQGAAEAAQTAKLTRQYMIRRYGDSRS